MVQVLMPRRKKIPGDVSPAPNTPVQSDVAEILDEVGAEPDEHGELIASEEAIREIGAIDAESVRENRRVDEVVAKQRANIKGVSFNSKDVLATYDGLIKVWGQSALDITIRRLTGSAVTHVISSHPQSGTALWEAIRVLHGQHEEAEYEVKFTDGTRKYYRGQGRIVMPDTRPQQGQQPMTFNPYGAPPPGYQPSVPGYPPPYPQQGPQQLPPVAPATQPAPPVPPASPATATDWLTQMRQAFEFFQSCSRRRQRLLRLLPPMPMPMYPAPPAGATPPTWLSCSRCSSSSVRCSRGPAAVPASATAYPYRLRKRSVRKNSIR